MKIHELLGEVEIPGSNIVRGGKKLYKNLTQQDIDIAPNVNLAARANLLKQRATGKFTAPGIDVKGDIDKDKNWNVFGKFTVMLDKHYTMGVFTI